MRSPTLVPLRPHGLSFLRVQRNSLNGNARKILTLLIKSERVKAPWKPEPLVVDYMANWKGQAKRSVANALFPEACKKSLDS